jgi:glucosylceramidase
MPKSDKPILLKRGSLWCFLILFCNVFSTTAQNFKNGFTATVYTTADHTGLRLSNMGTLEFESVVHMNGKADTISLDQAEQYQTILGIGGALTDASAEVYAKLSPEKQQKLLRSYYDPKEGIGYTLARTNMNSCDFSSNSYVYIADHDTSLNSFNISHDERYRIPFIKAAIKAAGGKLIIFLSPWSPPAWMKTNNDMLHGGRLLHQYRKIWAAYYAKFIYAYAKDNIPFWGLTVQNEPMSTQTWESCVFTAEDERDFVRDYLGPELVRQGLADKKIIIWDHNRDFMYDYSKTILDDPEAAKYVWGTGYHWYESWKDGIMQFDQEKRLKDDYPANNLLFTEGCMGNFDFKKVNSWSNGEHYGYSMINDFNNGTVGWTDWNILLDEHGGPNHVGNYCYAPVHANLETGELIYTPAYFYLGQFSKFIRPGAVRIGCKNKNEKLLCTAFLNPDGKIAVVVMNNSDESHTTIFKIRQQFATFNSLPHSISTIIIEQHK